MPRFFADTPLSLHQNIMLPESVFHHWVRVLRAQVDDTATLFNGLGGEFTAQLVDVTKKHANVQLTAFNPADRTAPYQVTLGQVMSKGDRLDYAIQKAVELGVHEIQLLTSERCEMRLKYERDQKKLQHWQHIAIAACEQCGMNRIPRILNPLPLVDWLAQTEATQALKLVMAPSQQPHAFTSPLANEICVLIGPEGGLSEIEIATAKQHGFAAWTLGERILRTETAPVAALSALMFAHEMLS